MDFLYILLIIIATILMILLDWFIARQFKLAAEAKGFMDEKYFWMCFCLNIIGYLLVIALPDRSQRKSAIADELPDL